MLSAASVDRDLSGSPLTFRRVLRQLATFFILLCLLTIVRFPYSTAAERAFAVLQSQLLTQGITVSGESIAFAAPKTLSIRNLSVRVPAGSLVIPFFADEVKLKFQLLRLLLLQGAMEANLSAYQGALDAKLIHALTGSTTSVTINGHSLALESHPLLAPYGLKGKLMVNVDADLKAVSDKQTADAVMISRGSYRLRADEVSYGGGHRIKGIFALPATENLQLDIIAGQQENRLTLEQVNLFSPFGTATGSGRVYLDARNEISRANFSVTISLSPEGRKAFGGYLALAAGVGIDHPSQRWSLTISKEENSPLPVVKATPL